jgi:predicted O-methyltransferase YrrM
VAVLGNADSLAYSVAKLHYKPETMMKINSKAQKELKLCDRSFEFTVETDFKIRQRLEYHAKTLFQHFKMKDIARFDFILDKTYYLLEANTSPIPGNSFSWEWQVEYGVKKEQVIALFLCAFHFGQVASGKASRIPVSLIDSIPKEIISMINQPSAVDVCPECSGPTDNCINPHLFSMSDRVSSETEVHSFLNVLTKILKPNYILETGTHKGNSTIAFAEGLRHNNFGSMTTLEIDKSLAETARIAFSEYPVNVINQHSLAYIPQTNIDLLFLDSKRDIRIAEFEHFLPYLNDKAVIVWHDSSYREQNHSVYDAVESLYKNKIIDRILFPTPRGLTLSMLCKQ